MREGIRITDPKTPTPWLLVQEIRRASPDCRIVGQHLEGSDKEGAVYLVLEDDRGTTAAVCLFERFEDADGWWLEHRMIHEEEGPVAIGCPTRLLDMLSPPRNPAAEHWRSCCRALVGTPALDPAPIAAGDHVFLPVSSIPLPRAVAANAMLRCLSARGGFAKAVEIDPSTGDDLGLARLDLISADLRRTAFPLPENRKSLALDMREFFSGPMPDLSEFDELPDFGRFMSSAWKAGGEAWRPKPIELMAEEEIEEQKAAVASGGLLLTLQSLYGPDIITVRMVFGPSGEAVAVDIDATCDLEESGELASCYMQIVADLECSVNLPVEPADMSYVAYGDENGRDPENDEADEQTDPFTI